MTKRSGAEARPCYGEVWTFVAAEGEAHTADVELGVIVSTDAVGLLPWRIVARVEGEGDPTALWQVPAPVTEESGLPKGSFVDTTRLASFEDRLWGERVGRLPADCMDEIAAAIAILVEFDEG